MNPTGLVLGGIGGLFVALWWCQGEPRKALGVVALVAIACGMTIATSGKR